MALAPSNRTLAQRYHPGTVYRSSHRCPVNRESTTPCRGHSAASKFVGGGTGPDEMGKDVGDERRPEPSEVQGRMREADRGVGEKTETLRRAADGTQT